MSAELHLQEAVLIILKRHRLNPPGMTTQDQVAAQIVKRITDLQGQYFRDRVADQIRKRGELQ
jgi:hypothetical protein